MSPVGVTLVHAIINILYDIQDKEPWSNAISQVCAYLTLMDPPKCRYVPSLSFSCLSGGLQPTV